MACEPFDCEKCGQRHERCTGHVDRLPDGTEILLRPCSKWPRKGAKVCQKHGGNARQIIAATEIKKANEQAQKLLNIEGFEPVTDPYTALSDLAGEVVKLKDVLRQKVEELTTLRSYGGEAAGEQIDIHMQAYERALDRAEKILSGMARLDLEGRIARLHTRINEDTTALIMKAMNDALDAVDMTGNVREVVLSVLGARLRGDTREYRQPAIATTTIATTLAEDSKTGTVST